MKTISKYILISIIISLVSIEILAQDSLTNNNTKKWQIGFNLSDNQFNYKNSVEIPSSNVQPSDFNTNIDMSYSRRNYQWDFYLKRHFTINDKISANIGLAFRYMPFDYNSGFQKDSICNITILNIEYQFAFDFPIMIKYHLIRVFNNNDFYVYGGIKLSIYNYYKHFYNKESVFFDPNINQYVTYKVNYDYFDNNGSDKEGRKFLFDANISAGFEYQYNSEIALSFEANYLPRKILMLNTNSSFDDAKGYIGHNTDLYRSHFYWGIGASYLF